MSTHNSSGSSGRSSIFSGLKSRRSISPNVHRLLELTVIYQQQQQDSQNALPSTSASPVGSMSTWIQDTSKKIRTLVKELGKQKQNNLIEDLERAILRRESCTQCITVPKSFGQSSSTAAVVVEFCSLWRWPDLSNERFLKPVNYCQNAFHYQLDQICINPFHYERVTNAYIVSVPLIPPEPAQQRMDRFPETKVVNTMPQNTSYCGTSVENFIAPSASVSSQISSTRNEHDSTDENDGSNMMDIDEMSQATQNQINPNLVTQVRLEESREWCRISYYEMSTRVGEQYRATQPYVIIDGYTNTSDSYRFSLGCLANNNRSPEIESVRRAIGLGVKLYDFHGDVYAECLSQNAVFVQSPIGNILQGWDPSTVCKIKQNIKFKIFDVTQFREILSAAIQEGYESVFNLTKICNIRMSLVKGWGVDYGRSLVSSTPCWVEIYLDSPLKWIDNILLTMNGPQRSVNSGS